MVLWTVQEALLFTLLVFRMAGLMTVTPIFGAEAVPVRLRVLFSVLLAFAVFGAMPRQPLPATHGDFALAIIGELTIGAALGFVSSVMFSAVRYAGELIDQQMGFSLSETIDPFSDQGGTLTGQMHSYLFILIFFFLNGHVRFLEVFLETVARIPVGAVNPRVELLEVFTGLMQATFVYAVQFAAPVIALLTMINIALGFISRTVPTMNVLILGFPIKILMGLGLMMAVLGQILSHTPDVVRDVIRGAENASNALFRTDG